MTTSPPSVRPAVLDDAPALAALAAATFALACPPGTRQESIERFIAENLAEVHFVRHLVDADRILTVVDGATAGRLQGYTMLVRGEPRDTEVAGLMPVAPVIEVSKVYVRADSHGTGVAALLMRETLARAASTGARAAWLGVNRANSRAIRFYGKSGFRSVGKRTFDVGGEPQRDLVLLRELG